MSRLRALSLLVITLSLTLSSAPRLALGSGLFELSGGPSHVLGGALKSAGGGGAQLLVAWGGRPGWGRRGTALYGYGSLSYDRFSSEGIVELGAPSVSREHLGLGLGLRAYTLIKGPVRAWASLGIEEVFENARLKLEGLDPHELSDQALSVTGAAGLQYRLRPGLLLSLAYYVTRLGAQEERGLIERSLLTSSEEGPWGRGRLWLGVAHVF